MPEYIVGIALTALLGALGFLNRRIDMVNTRLENHELKVAENYITKVEVSQNFERLFEMLMRLEDKVDAHVSEEPRKIDRIKRKYNL